MIDDGPAFVSTGAFLRAPRICIWMVTSSAVVGSSAIRVRARSLSPSRSWPAVAFHRTTRGGIDRDAARGSARRRATEQLRPPLPPDLPLYRHRLVPDGLADLVPDSETGLSEVIGSWKIIAMSSPRDRDAAPSTLQEIHPLEDCLSAYVLPGGIGISPSMRGTADALPRSRFPRDPEGLPPADGERETVDRLDNAFFDREVDDEILYRQCRLRPAPAASSDLERRAGRHRRS